MVDLEEGLGGSAPHLFWVKKKKESQKEEKPIGQATINSPPSLAQGLDLPFNTLCV